MSTATQPTQKVEKPTLAGASIKTRKRNIAVPLDPGSFANAVVQIFEDSKESGEVEKTLEAAAKVLDIAELDFKRYGDTYFEVLFAGGRMGSGGNTAEGQKLEFNVMACEATREAILPYIKFFQTQVRRKPFLIKNLENTLVKLIMSMDFFDGPTRKKIAIAMARIFALKVGVLPDHVLITLLNDRLVSKGTMLDFATDMFVDFMATESIEELVALLRKARLEDRLTDIFPPQKRTDADFGEHFKAAGLSALVDYNQKKIIDRNLEDLTKKLEAMVSEEPLTPAAECVTFVATCKKEHTLPEAEVVKSVWSSLIKSLSMAGKNQQQIQMAVLKQVKQYAKLLGSVCTSGKLELQLLVTVQVQCYEDSRLLRLFKDVVRLLYDTDVVQEDTIKYWYNKGSHPKGRNVFLKDLEPFIKWLEEAEEEEEEDDE